MLLLFSILRLAFLEGKLMNPRVLTLALSLASSFLASCPTPGWNQAYGNSRNSSYIDVNTEDALNPKWDKVLWSNTSQEPGFEPSAPVISPDGSVVVTGSRISPHLDAPMDGRVRCLEPDGTLRFEIITSGMVSTPAIAANRRIFIVGQEDDRRGPSGAFKNMPTISCYDHQGNQIITDGSLTTDSLGKKDDGTAVSPPKVEGEFVYVVVSHATDGVGLLVFDDSCVLVKRLDLGCKPKSTGTARWLYPPAVAPNHAGIGNVVLVSIALDDCFVVTSWNPATREFGPVTPLAYTPMAPTVVGTGGEIVARGANGLETWDWPNKTPKHCGLAPAVPGTPLQPPSLQHGRADAYVYVPYADSVAILSSATCDPMNAPTLDRPSAAVVTKNRVHVSAWDGLYTYGWQLDPTNPQPGWSSVAGNHSVREPAVGPDGTVYEVYRLIIDGSNVVSLRAFGGRR
jgi:hypothetical protein